MSEERGCKWHFAEFQGGREIGPNDSSIQNFRESPFNSLIRESIQNSVDVALDLSRPVEVRISFKTLYKDGFPQFFQTQKHIRGCLEYYSGNPNAEKIYGPMLQYIEDSIGNGSIDYICISDSNTKGMHYVKGDTNCPFYAFVRSIGVSAKNSFSAGGSYGFGKAAYYNISPISTVLVSTMTEQGEHFFEGAACLCTHKCDNKVMVDFGFYDNNCGEPVCRYEDIPVSFRQNEPGTSINVMGVSVSGQREAVKDTMVMSVLKNFWFAIYGGKLEVDIDGKKITKDTLERFMSFYFPEIEDNVNGMGKFCPRPYYEAVRLADNSVKDKKCRYFSEDNEKLGRIQLYCLIDKTAKKDRVIYMRQPRMLVSRKPLPSNYGVYALFFCEDDKGNQLLRNTENPAHDRWEISNCNSDIDRKEAKAALNEIERFIKDSLKKISDMEGRQVLNIAGLEEYLYSLPDNLLEDDMEGKPETVGNDSNDDAYYSSVSSSDIRKEIKMQERSEDTAGSVLVKKEGRAIADETSSYMAGHGHTKPHSLFKGGIPSPGNSFAKSRIDERSSGSHKVALPVKFRVAVREIDDTVTYYIFLHCNETIDNGEIVISVCGEINNEDIDISECNKGEIYKNTIMHLHLTPGKNILKLRFKDNMIYSLKLGVYENR